MHRQITISFANNFEFYEFIDSGVLLISTGDPFDGLVKTKHKTFVNMRAVILNNDNFLMIGPWEYDKYKNISYEEWKLLREIGK